MHPLVAAAAVSGFLAVALGAFGAHAFEARWPADRMAAYRSGVQYHMFHSLAALGAATLEASGAASGLALGAGWLWLGGVALFSGSVYGLAAGGPRRLGAVTPVGGLCFLAGWALLALAVVGRRG